MKTNMGAADRTIRLAAAAVIALLYAAGYISGAAAIVFGVLAAVFLVTSLAGSCPAYSLIGFSTRKKRL